jgi:predicted alpha/beta-fold hydrolase
MFKEILVIILLSIITLWVVCILLNSGKVKIIGKNNAPAKFLGSEHPFYLANILIGFNAHLNTFAAFMFGKDKGYRCRREKYIGVDGGQFFVDWFDLDSSKSVKISSADDSSGSSSNSTTPSISTAPTIVFVHGINGGSSEPSIQSVALTFKKKYKDWNVCCLIFRGCCGTLLTTVRSYNGGFSEGLFFTKLKKKNNDKL